MVAGGWMAAGDVGWSGGGGAVGVGWRFVYWMGWMMGWGALTGLVLLSAWGYGTMVGDETSAVHCCSSFGLVGETAAWATAAAAAAAARHTREQTEHIPNRRHGPFSAAFLADRGRPSSLRRVRPTVFLNQLYIC